MKTNLIKTTIAIAIIISVLAGHANATVNLDQEFYNNATLTVQGGDDPDYRITRENGIITMQGTFVIQAGVSIDFNGKVMFVTADECYINETNHGGNAENPPEFTGYGWIELNYGSGDLIIQNHYCLEDLVCKCSY